MYTMTGGYIKDVSCPQPKEVRAMDIVLHGTRIPRFHGMMAPASEYNNISHSMLVGLCFTVLSQQYAWPFEWAAYAFLHDAHEAYWGDISKTVKRVLPGGMKEEDKACRAVVGVLVAGEQRIFPPWTACPTGTDKSGFGTCNACVTDREMQKAIKHCDRLALLVEMCHYHYYCDEWLGKEVPVELLQDVPVILGRSVTDEELQILEHGPCQD